MITKEELLVAFEESTRTLELNNQIFGLALKGLESEKIEGKEFIPIDEYKDLMREHRIAVNILNDTVDGLRRNRNFWKKKHDDLADELDDKIIALEEKLKSKNADLDVASKMIDDAQAKYGALQAQLKNTIPLQFHNAWEDDLLLTIISLRDERDAFQRSVSEMHAENNCMRADLENMCKELSVLKIENKKWEDAHRAKNADIDKLFTENKELARRERELRTVLGEWAAVEVYLAKSPKLTIGDKFSVACLHLLQERDKLEADLRFLLGQ